jgi:hypothetical protein
MKYQDFNSIIMGMIDGKITDLNEVILEFSNKQFSTTIFNLESNKHDLK